MAWTLLVNCWARIILSVTKKPTKYNNCKPERKGNAIIGCEWNIMKLRDMVVVPSKVTIWSMAKCTRLEKITSASVAKIVKTLTSNNFIRRLHLPDPCPTMFFLFNNCGLGFMEPKKNPILLTIPLFRDNGRIIPIF